jgi:clan AA aspartic protease
MIAGVVNDQLEVIFNVAVRSNAGRSINVSAQFDTGFSGALILPDTSINALGLQSDGAREATLADGRVVILGAYRGAVIWDGREVDVQILGPGDVPLLGMDLFRGFQIQIEAVPDGAVVVNALRSR